MNFQAVESGRGNKVTMFGVFMEIGGVQYTPQQKAKSICKIADDNGVSHNVHIYQGTGQLPQPAQLQQRHSFSLSTFEGNYQGKPYTGYSGFWQDNAQTRQQAPPQAPQAPQQPAGATNAPKEVDWDAKDLRNARMNGLNNATAMITVLAEILKDANMLDKKAIEDAASYFVDYIYNGRPQDEQQVDDSQIPF